MELDPKLPPWYKTKEGASPQDLEERHLDEIIHQAFDCIKCHSTNYEERKSQIQMSEAILKALYHGKTAVIEAGTGIGKSFAYISAALALSYVRGIRILVTTETKNLQLQIFEKDLRFIQKALDPSLRFSLCLGSSNYLCKLRYEETDNSGNFLHTISEKNFRQFQKWVRNIFRQNKEGNIYEMTFPVKHDFWSLVNRSSEGCPGSKCTHYNECNYYRAKSIWQKSRILVANHHLTLLNLQNDKKNLPEYGALIVDEAHGFLDTSYSIFSLSFQTTSFTEKKEIVDNYLIKEVRSKKIEKNIQEISKSIETGLNILFSFWQERLNLLMKNNETKIIDVKPDEKDSSTPKLKDVIGSITFLKDILDEQFEESENTLLLNAFNQFQKFMATLISFLNLFQDMDFEKVVYWGAIQKNIFSLHACPINLGEELEELFIQPQLWTSATLGYWPGGKPPQVKEEVIKQGYFKSFIETIFPLPISESNILMNIYKSEYSYKKNSILYISSLRQPIWNASELEKEKYEEKLLEELTWLIELSKGGVLILFTSYYLLNKVALGLESSLDYPIFSQGDLGAAKALEYFKENADGVLLGTSSFWQGIDLPGEQLRVLVITKLMFQPPDDPIFKARANQIKKMNKNPFMELALPYASTMLRQGFGRLIRTKQDKGIIAILDNRLIEKSYGHNLLVNIPKSEIVFERNLLLKTAQAKGIF